MKVSNKVTLLSAAVATLFASVASAQLVMAPAVTGGPAAASGNTYASEIATPFNLTARTVNTQVGIGFSVGQQLFIRYDFANASIATANLLATDVAVPNTNNNIVQSGGTIGSSNVIFSLTAGPAAVAVTDVAVLTIPTLSVTSTSGNVIVTYRVFQSNSDALGGTNALFTRTGNLAAFQSGLVFQNVSSTFANIATTATAASGFLNFSLNSNPSETSARTRVARVNLGASQPTVGACATFTCTAANAPVTVPTIVNTNSITDNITVAGDFSAAAGPASVDTNLDAAGTSNVATAVTATSATIPLSAASYGVGNTGLNGFAATVAVAPLLPSAAVDLVVRYTANGTTPIVPSAYTSTLNYTAQAGYVATPLGPITSGQIVRDGLTLESPWVTTTTGFISRFFITQTTNAVNVTYTATVRNTAGLVTGGTLTGVLGANRVTLIPLASLLPADTTAFPGPYQVTFAISATAAQTRGTYVLTSPTGTVTNTPLYTAALQ